MIGARPSRPLIPPALLLLAALGIASAFPLGALAVADGSTTAVSSVRYLSAVLIVGASVLARGGRAYTRIPRGGKLAVAAMGLTIAAFNLCFLAALRLLDPSAGALIIAGAMPVTTAAVAARWFGEPVRIRQAAGMALATAGIVIVFIATAATGTEEVGGNALIGASLYFLSGVIWGANSVISQMALRYVDPLTATFWSVVLGLAVLFPLAAVADGPQYLWSMGPSIWFAALLGIVSTAIPFLCLLAAIRRIGAARAAAGTFLVPIFAVLLDMLLLHQGLSSLEVVGGVLTIVGFVVITSFAPASAPVPSAG